SNLDRHRPPDLPGGTQPGRGAVGQPQQLTADDLGVVDVAGEGLFRADALVRFVRDDRPLVAAPGERVQVRTRGRAEGPRQGGCRCVGDVTDGAQTETGEDL